MLPLSRQNAYREKYKRQRPQWRSSGEVLEALARACLTPAACVLDVGCGRGGVLELLGREVRLPIGLDPDWASLREHRAPFAVAGGLGEALPFASATFDVVLAVWVLEHLPHPARVCAEVQRVLKPGGHFIFLTPNAQHPIVFANRFSQAMPAVQRLLIPRLYGRAEADTFRVHYRANTPARLRALAAAHGFRVEALHCIADPTYLAFNDILFQFSVAVEAALPREWAVHLVGQWTVNSKQ